MAYLATVSVLLLTVSVQTLSAAVSHSENYSYYTTVSKQECGQKSSKACSGSDWWGTKRCSDNYWYDCNVVYAQELQIGTRCQTGWSPPDCTTPICKTPCIDGKVCTAPDTCECKSTGRGCLSVPCDDEKNCYPGTCIKANCSCPSGFSGTNCLNIEKTPDISVCKVQLYNASTSLFKEVTCEAAGIEPRTTTWISAKTLSKVQVKWTTNYVQPFSLPGIKFAPHVRNAPVLIGVTETGFTVSSPTIGDVVTGCSLASPVVPQPTVNCNVPKELMNIGFTQFHNQTLRVDVSSKLGGHKDGAKTIYGSNFLPQYFIGTPLTRSALFRFDLVPPVHCLSNPNNDCGLFAIYMEQDITKNPIIEAKFYNWTDDGSGISKFHVEVYFMQPGTTGLLENVRPPLIQSDIRPHLNDFIYTCIRSGVYSIELTVEDQAGNTARARKLFIFNKDSKLTTNPKKPVYIKEADPENGYKYITKFDDPRNRGNIPLTLVWTGHFSSNAEFHSAWGNEAQQWSGSSGIDDRFQNRYGRRSIYGMGDVPNGIISYGVSYIVDQNGGGKGLVPQNWVFINSTQETYALPIQSLTDGSTIVIWLECDDVAGGRVMGKIVVSVDRTPPSVQEAIFTANEIDESTSRISIKTFDTGSGVSQISFAIYESKLKILVYSGSSGAQKRDPPTSQANRKKRLVQPCTPSDSSCYCTPPGDCYNYIQTVVIDNCWLDRLPGHTFEFRFTVTNGANLTSSEQTVALGELALECRKNQRSIIGIAVGSILGFLLFVAMVIVIVLLVRVYAFKKPVPHRLISVQQTFRNKFSRARLDENIAYMTATELQPKNNQGQRVTSKPKVKPTTKASKAEEMKVFDQEIYADLTQCSATAEADSPGDLKIISNKQLKCGDKIAQGRFAVITSGRLTRGNKTIPVATKGLISGYTDADANLMTDKIVYQSQIPSHVNVVKFLGQLEDKTKTGPVMVLEHCEMTLQDWLGKIESINDDVLEDMLIFTMNIADGVRHLHENQVVHRRLGARNVLLKEQYGRYVAKLIGFGPNREDKGAEQVSVPIKWLAPETLKTLNNGSPTYDKNSDAWSFGVTVWEIYSEGQVPYSDLKNDKVLKLLTKDKRMVLTRPEACPNDLFKNVVAPCWNFTASKRPSFAELCSKLDTFHKGTGLDSPGCYASKSSYSGECSKAAEIELYDDAA